jgi:hypothetical protein
MVDGRRELWDQSVVAEAVAEFGVGGQLSVNQLSERARVDAAGEHGGRSVPRFFVQLHSRGISFDLRG